MTAHVADRAAGGPVYREPSFRARDLGSLLIEVDGVETGVRWRKPAQILAVLLINANQRVSVDTLLDVVWGELASESKAGTLETHVWRLRKLIEPDRPSRVEPTYLVNDSGGYRLTVNTDNADSLRFSELAGQGDGFLASGEAARALDRYELALGLWRGRPFDPIADDHRAAAPIARLDEMHGQVHERRVEALLRVGEPERAISTLEELTVQLPFREELWSQLMRALYQTGRIEEALTAYRRARESLLENVGLDPSPALRDLHQQILDQDAALAALPRQRLPVRGTVDAPDLGAEVSEVVGADPTPDLPGASAVAASNTVEVATPRPAARHDIHLPVLRSELIGRDTELAGLTKLVGRTRLTTLVGAGGAGKTRLAIEVARAAASLAPDGVWFVDLSAVDDVDSVAQSVMSTVGLAEPTVGTALTALRSYVRDREVLLLIDNCEHLLSGVRTLVDAVLDEASQARVIATSREPIGVDGETLWSLGPLTVLDDTGSGGGPSEAMSPAARLFVSKAQNVDATFELTAPALADIESICSAVDGIPLAIELAAGRIRSASLAEVREQVHSALGELSRIGYTPVEHHRTVDLSIEWSVRLLRDTERAAHARLSVLPGVFTVEAAQGVLASEPGRSHETGDLLSMLVYRSLLAVVPGVEDGQPTRFRQLATVRAHAAAALADSGEQDEALERRRRWVDGLIATRPGLDAADHDGWYARVAYNHDTLHAVLHHALVERSDETAVGLVGALANYWPYRERLAEGERWSSLALRLAGAETADVTLVQLSLAAMVAYRDRADLAVPLVHRAMANGHLLTPCEFAQLLATAEWCASLREDSALDFVESEVQRVAQSDPASMLWADLLAARRALATQGPTRSRIRAETLVQQAVERGNVSVAWLGSALAASCAMLEGDSTRGAHWLRCATDYQHQAGNVGDLGRIEFEGNLAAMVGDYEQAARLFARSRTMSFRLGSPWPIRSWTDSALARIRRALPVDQFEAAWQDGVALGDSSSSSEAPRHG